MEKQQKERQIEIIAKLLEEEKIAQREEQKKSKSHWTARSGTHHPPAKVSVAAFSKLKYFTMNTYEYSHHYRKTKNPPREH